MEPNIFRKLTFSGTLTRLHTLFCLFKEHVSAFTSIHFHLSSGAGALLSTLPLVSWVLRISVACFKPRGWGGDLGTWGNLKGLGSIRTWVGILGQAVHSRHRIQ